MIVAVDCDGTFTKYPELFIELSKALRAAGHKVIMLTGNRYETMVGERADKYPLLMTDPPWFDEMVTWDDAYTAERENLRTMSAREAVGIFKRRVCAERGVAVMFDDDVEHVRDIGGVPVFGVA